LEHDGLWLDVLPTRTPVTLATYEQAAERFPAPPSDHGPGPLLEISSSSALTYSPARLCSSWEWHRSRRLELEGLGYRVRRTDGASSFVEMMRRMVSRRTS